MWYRQTPCASLMRELSTGYRRAPPSRRRRALRKGSSAYAVPPNAEVKAPVELNPNSRSLGGASLALLSHAGLQKSVARMAPTPSETQAYHRLRVHDTQHSRDSQPGQRFYQEVPLGAKDCPPEIDGSEIIVDFQWHFPMDFQWHFPMEFHFCDFWCVILCPEPRAAGPGRRASSAPACG